MIKKKADSVVNQPREAKQILVAKGVVDCSKKHHPRRPPPAAVRKSRIHWKVV
ncbi:MAG: hypothetical protein WAP55_02835 [Minisyncoccia bacterium]